jgi:hypothetical protein
LGTIALHKPAFTESKNIDRNNSYRRKRKNNGNRGTIKYIEAHNFRRKALIQIALDFKIIFFPTRARLLFFWTARSIS